MKYITAKKESYKCIINITYELLQINESFTTMIQYIDRCNFTSQTLISLRGFSDF